MGAQAGTLRAVETLGGALHEVEQRLFEIEDVALHHEAGLFRNNGLLIAGKMIPSSPSTKLIVGPVLGIIGSTFFRILVETDSDGSVSLNLFRNNVALQCQRFVKTVHMKVAGGSPTAFSVSDLEPGTEYCVYLGGIDPAQTLDNVVLVRTLDTLLSDFRCFVAHRNGVQSFVPGESAVWKRVDEALSISGGPSLLLNLGDFLVVEHHWWAVAHQILQGIDSDVQSVSDWESKLLEFEQCVRRSYQQALTSPLLQRIGKRCGLLLVAGKSESLWRALRTLATLHGLSGGLSEGDAEDLDEAEEDAQSLFGSVVASIAQRQDSERSAAKQVRMELASLLLAAFARILRRTNWLYCRQLWDDSVASFLVDDARRDALLLQVARATMMRLSKLRARDTLAKAAAMAVNTIQISSLEDELQALHEELRKLAVLSGEINLTLVRPAPVLSVSCGPLFLVIVDSAWGHISSDGSLDFSRLEVGVDESVLIELEDLSLPLHKREGREVREEARLLLVAATEPVLPLQTGASAEMGRLALEDARKLVAQVALWQQADDRRAAALLGAAGQPASLACEVAPQISATNAADDVWRADRCAVVELLCGTLNRDVALEAPQFGTRARDFAALLEADDPAFLRRAVEVDARPGVWLLGYQPDAFAARNGSVFSQPARLTRHSLAERAFASASVAVGPVLGRVSSSSAALLLESAQSGRCVLSCVEALTGLEVMVSQFLRAGQPSLFMIEGLRPNRHYHVSFTADGRPCASFTTTRVPCSTEGTVAQHGVLRATVGLSTIEATAAGVGTQEVRDAFRLAIVGHCPSSFAADLAGMRGAGTNFARKFDESAQLGSGLGDWLQQPWGGLDCVLHAGAAVDWRAALDAAVRDLVLAEQLLTAHRVGPEAQELIERAQRRVTDALRTSWGADPAARGMLAQGCHLLVSDPVVEVLRGQGAASMASLARDLSPFCLRHLVEAVGRVHNEYVQPLWAASALSDASPVLEIEGCALLHLPFHAPAVESLGGSALSFAPETLRGLAEWTTRQTADTLVLCSALSLLGPRPARRRHAALHVAPASASAVLDLCWQWLRGDATERRQVVLVSSTMGRSFSSSVEIRDGELRGRVLQVCCGCALEADCDDDLALLDIAQASGLPGVEYRVTHVFADADHPRCALLELRACGESSLEWLDAEVVRQRAMAAVDTLTLPRVQEDAVLQSFLEQIPALPSDNTQQALQHLQALLDQEHVAFSAAFDELNARTVKASATSKLLRELRDITMSLFLRFRPALRRALRMPSSPALFSAWKMHLEALRSAGGGQGGEEGLLLLQRDPTRYEAFMRAALATQLRAEGLAWESGLLDC